jgi:hypothetical protein
VIISGVEAGYSTSTITLRAKGSDEDNYKYDNNTYMGLQPEPRFFDEGKP